MRKSVFAIILCVVLTFTACKGTVDKLDRQDVDAITIRFHGSPSGEYCLNDEEIDRCVELYNQSTNSDKYNGEGGTPYYQVTIQLKNDNTIDLSESSHYAYDFISKNGYDNAVLEFFYDYYSNGRYIVNEKLVTYVEQLIEVNFSVDFDDIR